MLLLHPSQDLVKILNKMLSILTDATSSTESLKLRRQEPSVIDSWGNNSQNQKHAGNCLRDRHSVPLKLAKEKKHFQGTFSLLQFTKHMKSLSNSSTFFPFQFFAQTYRLANAGISGLGYASHKDPAGQENMEAQVHKHVPALETDSDQTVKRKRKILILRLVHWKQDTTVPTCKTFGVKCHISYAVRQPRSTHTHTHTLFENSFNSISFLNTLALKKTHHQWNFCPH